MVLATAFPCSPRLLRRSTTEPTLNYCPAPIVTRLLEKRLGPFTNGQRGSRSDKGRGKHRPLASPSPFLHFPLELDLISSLYESGAK
jgi:hypothetical protein